MSALSVHPAPPAGHPISVKTRRLLRIRSEKLIDLILHLYPHPSSKDTLGPIPHSSEVKEHSDGKKHTSISAPVLLSLSYYEGDVQNSTHDHTIAAMGAGALDPESKELTFLYCSALIIFFCACEYDYVSHVLMIRLSVY